MLLEKVSRRLEAEDLPGVVVQPRLDPCDFLLADAAEAGALREPAPDHAVLLFVAASLVAAVRVAVHLYYTSVRGAHQGCLRLGTFCLVEETGRNRQVTARFFAEARNLPAHPEARGRPRQTQF